MSSSPQPAAHLTTGSLYLAVLIVLLVGGGVLVAGGINLQYYGRFGPGPGFFPVWIGGALALLSAIAIGQALMRKNAQPAPAFESMTAFWRVLAALVSLAILLVLIGIIGFRLAVLLYMLTAPLLIARLPLFILVPIALLASFGAAHVFEAWLLVRLPHAAIPFLANMGL